MFGVAVEGLDPNVRRTAKMINFGVIYGISSFGLARNARVPRDQAQVFIDRYFERFPAIRDHMAGTLAFARERGYVETLFGRRIHTPEVRASGHAGGYSRRAAQNAPIQGTAADIIRRAMIRMEDATRDLDATMLLQVHDELLFEVAEDDVDPPDRARPRGDGGGAPPGRGPLGAARGGRRAGTELGRGALKAPIFGHGDVMATPHRAAILGVYGGGRS